MTEIQIMYGYKYLRFERFVCCPIIEPDKKKKSNYLYLLELLIGKAAVVGFKSTFSLNNG